MPSLGWEQTIAFLSIPVFLTISQVISMNLMQPKSDDPQQAQANVILKVLPFMVGWFALNVPAALGIYWVVNNIVTTATTLYIRNSMPKMEPISGGGGTMMSSSTTTTTANFNPTPMNERAVGFGGRSGTDSADGMKTITPVVDAEIVAQDDYATVGGNEMPDIPAAPTGKVSPAARCFASKRSECAIVDFPPMMLFLLHCLLHIFLWMQRGTKKKKRRKD